MTISYRYTQTEEIEELLRRIEIAKKIIELLPQQKKLVKKLGSTRGALYSPA